MATVMSPVTGNLEQIREKVRRITGMISVNSISNNNLDAYINDFYVYDMPQHVKLLNLENVISPLLATTPSGDNVLLPNVMVYVIDWNKYTNIAPPFYVAGYEVAYYQDHRSFLASFPSFQSRQTLATGTGVAGPYTGTITNTPILAGTLFMSVLDGAGNTLTAYVTDAGVITGDVLAGGTINLTTGAVAGLTWTALIPLGNDITVQTLSYSSGRPLAVLFYNRVLMFYPIPDISYEVACTVNYAPDALEIGDQPEIRQWWNVIALGAALKIFIDNMDMESYAKIKPIFDEQLRLVERRTLCQLSNQRVPTIYSADVPGRASFNLTI